MTDIATGEAIASDQNDGVLPNEELNQTEADAQSVDADLMKIWEKHNRSRDESGKFVPRQTDAAGAEPAPTGGTEPEGHSPEGAEKEPARPAIQPPNSWPAEMKAKFGEFSPDAQEYFLKRENEIHSAISRQGQQIKSFEPVSRVLEHNKDVFDRVGLSFDQGIQALLNAQRMLEQNPVSALQALAGQFGVDLTKLNGNAESHDGGSQPELMALRAQVASMQRQLLETSNRVTTREQRETADTLKSLEAQIAEFAKTKPDYAEIENDMAALIPVLRERKPGLSTKEMLETAYEQAGWLNPERRAKMLEADAKVKADKEAEEARKKAAEAKRVQSINVKSGSPASPKKPTVDDDLMAIARKHYGT